MAEIPSDDSDSQPSQKSIVKPRPVNRRSHRSTAIITLDLIQHAKSCPPTPTPPDVPSKKLRTRNLPHCKLAFCQEIKHVLSHLDQTPCIGPCNIPLCTEVRSVLVEPATPVSTPTVENLIQLYLPAEKPPPSVPSEPCFRCIPCKLSFNTSAKLEIHTHSSVSHQTAVSELNQLNLISPPWSHPIRPVLPQDPIPSQDHPNARMFGVGMRLTHPVDPQMESLRLHRASVLTTLSQTLPLIPLLPPRISQEWHLELPLQDRLKHVSSVFHFLTQESFPPLTTEHVLELIRVLIDRIPDREQSVLEFAGSKPEYTRLLSEQLRSVFLERLNEGGYMLRDCSKEAWRCSQASLSQQMRSLTSFESDVEQPGPSRARSESNVAIESIMALPVPENVLDFICSHSRDTRARSPPLVDLTESDEEEPPVKLRVKPKNENARLEECVVCMDARPDTVFLPCRHLCCCATCVAKPLRECPMCRAGIRDHFTVFRN